jgi:hypothetical protein
MTPSGTAAIPAGLRRLVAGTLFAAALTVGSGAFGYPATVRADSCDGGVFKPPNPQQCCVDQGGTWLPNFSGGCNMGVKTQTPPTTLRPVMTPVTPPTQNLP